jgi:hypothetical protein
MTMHYSAKELRLLDAKQFAEAEAEKAKRLSDEK